MTRARVWDEDATLLRRHGMRSSAPHLSDTTGGRALGDACDSARAQPGHTAEKAEARRLLMRLGLEQDARHRRRLQQVVEALHAADVAHEERDSIGQGEVAAIEVRDGGDRPMRTAKIHVVWIVEGPHTLPARGIGDTAVAHADAVSMGVGPEVAVEGAMLLHDHDDGSDFLPGVRELPFEVSVTWMVPLVARPGQTGGEQHAEEHRERRKTPSSPRSVAPARKTPRRKSRE